jgi:hypothetical protein
MMMHGVLTLNDKNGVEVELEIERVYFDAKIGFLHYQANLIGTVVHVQRGRADSLQFL